MDKKLLGQIQHSIDELQRQLEDLKSSETHINPLHPRHACDSELETLLEERGREIMETASDIARERGEIGGLFVAVAGAGQEINSSYLRSWNEIDEEEIASALEAFTNPRRIAILKAISQPMTSGEITKKTGCVGGQLYHHLSNLETRGLIRKIGDKYAVRAQALTSLLGLMTVIKGLPR